MNSVHPRGLNLDNKASVVSAAERTIEFIDASELIDPALIAKRDWIVPDTCLRGYISLLIAPGGTGKSVFALTLAISVAIGRDLLGLGTCGPGKVILINNEDDLSELNRRICAICAYYSINARCVKDRLKVYSGYNDKLMIAEESDGEVRPCYLDLEVIESKIQEFGVDLMVLDPFVSTHSCNENDNVKMDAVVAILKKITGKHSISTLLVHHTRKSTGQRELDVESGRGASAIKDAARIVKTLERLDKRFAKKSNICAEQANRTICLRDAKANFSALSTNVLNFRLTPVDIGNGEIVAVPVKVTLPVVENNNVDNAELKRNKIVNRMAQVAYDITRGEGGCIKGMLIRQQYEPMVDVGKTTSDEHLKLLPVSAKNAKTVTINGHKFTIYRTQGEKKTSPHYVHLERQS